MNIFTMTLIFVGAVCAIRVIATAIGVGVRWGWDELWEDVKCWSAAFGVALLPVVMIFILCAGVTFSLAH